MKIAVTATGPSLDDQVEPRFGRAPYYLFIDPETMEFEAIQNPNVAAGGGAGIQSAQLMSEHGAKYVLTGNCGPNAFQVFGAAGIKVIVGVSGIARQAVKVWAAVVVKAWAAVVAWAAVRVWDAAWARAKPVLPELSHLKAK